MAYAEKMNPMTDEQPARRGRLSLVPNIPEISGRPIRHAYFALQAGFIVAPLIAGADKFTQLLVDWDQYLAPQVPEMLGIRPRTFMRIVGLIEMTAGIGVMLKPRIFGYVVSAWLLGIVGNLLMRRDYYDIALRDFGLSIGAFALGRIADDIEKSKGAAA